MSSYRQTSRLPARASGFTLLELLVVIFLLALAMSIVGVKIAGTTAGPQLKTESRKLIALMRNLRNKSMAEGIVTGVELDNDALGYRLFSTETTITLPDGLALSIQPSSLSKTFTYSNVSGIFFYPDGSSNGGTLSLKSEAGEVDVSVNWLTGEVGYVPLPDSP